MERRPPRLHAPLTERCSSSQTEPPPIERSRCRWTIPNKARHQRSTAVTDGARRRWSAAVPDRVLRFLTERTGNGAPPSPTEHAAYGAPSS
jgi:hypothetical protein